MPAPIAAPVNRELLARDIAGLPADALVAQGSELRVYLAPAEALPNVLLEVGRERERTFRAVGEGTGESLDLDRFDATYLHLVLWDPGTSAVAGGYRLGPIDRCAAAGPEGLYTHTLYRFDRRFLDAIGPAVELGRSFVTPEYQRGFAPLLLLWQGIGAYLARNPHVRRLLGPVSVSADYSAESRALLCAALQRPEWRSEHAHLAHARRPFFETSEWHPRAIERALFVHDLDALAKAVAALESDGRAMPVLLRQYLRLGARAVGFEVDPAFGNSLGILCVLDLLDADEAILRRMLGAAAHEAWRSHHVPPVAAG